ncbi:MAG: U32 family peptidase [Bacteroidales bacterium]|nr:U32 family peptidase [Bacteroidales bacterium]
MYNIFHLGILYTADLFEHNILLCKYSRNSDDIRKIMIFTAFKNTMKLELLAPAKDLDHGIAAINHGADAVYIGAPRFSARKSVGADLMQIEELVRYSHFYNARVYAALNTILYDSELKEAEQLIHQLYNAGIDAVIIQDMGILEMNLPPVPLFASTQTNNASSEKVKFLEQTGFQRVILARELNLDQIAEIRQNTNVELETFIHGALCVSYSGQCYMSQAVCGRSGNRGDCAQPCRSSYDLLDADGNLIVKNKHLLSLKDLDLTREIPELIKAGITSFKIEGRLKDMAYIKNVVSWYRRIIDSYMADNPGYRKLSSGSSYIGFNPDPVKTFNRGYTSYNIKGRNEKLATYDTQKSTGLKIGVVGKIKGKSFEYQGKKLLPGDGLCFFSQTDELNGFYVNIVDGNLIFPSSHEGIFEGAVLYRNFDKAFDKQLNLSNGQRKIAIRMILEGNEHEIKLILTDEDGNQIETSQQANGIIAENKSLAESQLNKQLAKLGNSSFVLKSLELNLDPVPFSLQQV